jgi:flagellar assembly protein FliH
MLIKLARAKKSKAIKQHALPDMQQGDLLIQLDHERPLNLEEAYTLVARQVEELQAALAEVHERRYNEGFAAGEKAGYQSGVDNIQESIQNLNQVLLEIQQQQTELLHGCEQLVVDFALKLLEKVMGTQEFQNLTVDSAKLQQLVERALSEFADSAKFVIRLHRDVAKIVEARKSEFNAMLVNEGTVVIVEDPSLQPGDCLIETDFGVLDARVESQINELKSVFSRQDYR